MEKDDLLKIINQYNFRVHPLCVEELYNLVIGKGFEKKFYIDFQTRLGILAHQGYQATKTSSFEKLTGSRGIYSMKLKSDQYNIRILYGYNNNSELFLLAFEEKSGKRTTDYSNQCPVAEQRLEELTSEKQPSNRRSYYGKRFNL